MTGGSSFEFHVQHAAAAIREGLCDTALVSYGSDFLSRRGRGAVHTFTIVRQYGLPPFQDELL